nr:zinc finger, CCHC-type [Tanacetum cinerariifolium]
MHSMGKTMTELQAMLKLHEQTLPPREVALALHAIRAGRIQKNQKKSHKAAKGNQGKGKAKIDDIYEIVMSSSNANDSSMYGVRKKIAKLNLDSALLCHCHLGHINKKCIEKLQHDGLLDSTNIKSFEKCVAYHLKELGIVAHRTPPYMSQMNRLLDRRNRTLLDMEILQTTRDFHSCKQEEGQSVSSYVLKMKSYIDNLERLGHNVTLGLGVSLILIGLGKNFDNMHSLGKTINELHAMLKLHEQTLPKINAPALHAIRAGKVQKVNKHKKSKPKMVARGQNHGNGKNKQAYAPKPKISPPPKREDLAKDSICHECGETGHWKRNCPQYLAELLKKKKNAASGAHCRLGHISKKRIVKLQNDEFLDSSDLRAFEKCVSCMSGKMARKPYTHQVERAKDLLGLIHTDVCGQFKIMSRQGASYFVTFTDDFSRSDRGGESTSQEFLNHLKDHGIIAHRTLPYTSQHNGVSERRNRTVLVMVRSMMSQTTLPKSFWDYALETAPRIINMVSTMKVEKTPYERKHKPRKKEKKETKVSLIEIPIEDHVPRTSNDPLPSGDDRMQLKELMDLCTNLSNKVETLEEENMSLTKELTSFYTRVESQAIKETVVDKEESSKQRRKIADIDADAKVNLESVFNLDMANEEIVLSMQDVDVQSERIEDVVKDVKDVVATVKNVEGINAATIPKISKDDVTLA